LVADIGLSLLPNKLLDKRGSFRKKEFLVYCKHTQFSLELLGQEKGIDSRIAGIVRCHHERHDGSGFPRNLIGE
jgi:HD-GYP domain-containing protein (c-di-GMP phosphodiesterase class II)